MARSRLFVGWRMPDSAAGELSLLAGAVRESFDRAGGRARWEETAKLHATLHFLGDVEDSAIPALGAALYRSVLSQDGATHSVLVRAHLG